MPDFDPNAYLADDGAGGDSAERPDGFDPNAYLADFDPGAYLSDGEPKHGSIFSKVVDATKQAADTANTATQKSLQLGKEQLSGELRQAMQPPTMQRFAEPLPQTMSVGAPAHINLPPEAQAREDAEKAMVPLKQAVQKFQPENAIPAVLNAAEGALDRYVLNPLRENIVQPEMDTNLAMLAAGTPDSGRRPNETLEQWRLRLSGAALNVPGGETSALLLSKGLTTLGGDRYFEQMSAPAVAAARARLPTWHLPVIGDVHPVEFGAELVGNPTNFVGYGLEGKLAVEGAPLLSRILRFTAGHALEGAAQGATGALADPNMSVTEGALGGAVLGPALAGGFKGVGAGGKKVVALLPKELIPKLVAELQNGLAKLQFKDALDAEHAAVAVADPAPVEPTAFFSIRARPDPDGRGTHFYADSVILKDGQATRGKEIPLNTSKERSNFRAYVKQHDTPAIFFDPEAASRIIGEHGDSVIHEIQGHRPSDSGYSEQALNEGIASSELTMTHEQRGKGKRAELVITVKDKKGNVVHQEARADPIRAVNQTVKESGKGAVKLFDHNEPTTPRPPPPPKEALLVNDADALPVAVNDADIVVVQNHDGSIQLKEAPTEDVVDALNRRFSDADAIWKEGLALAEAEAPKTVEPSTGARSSGSPPEGVIESASSQPGPVVEPIPGKKGWLRKTMPDGKVWEESPSGEHRLVQNADGTPTVALAPVPAKGRIIKSERLDAATAKKGISVTQSKEPLVQLRKNGPTTEPVGKFTDSSGNAVEVELVEPGEKFRYGEGDIGGGGSGGSGKGPGGGEGQWKSPGEPPIAEGPVIAPKPEFPDVSQGPLTESQLADLQLVVGAVKASAGAGTRFKQAWNKTLRLFLSPQHYGPPLLRNSFRKLQGAKALFAPDETFRAMEQRLIKAGVGDAAKPDSAFAKDLARMAEGEMYDVYSSPARHNEGPGASRKKLGEIRREVVNEKYMMEHHPVAWQALKEMARDMMETADQRGRELADLLGGAGESYLQKLNQMRDDGLWELYVARMYRSHYLGKKWKEVLPEETLNEGIEFVVRELEDIRRTGKGEYADKLRKADKVGLREHATKVVNDLIGQRDPMKEFVTDSDVANKPWSHLRQRNRDIPLPIQKLLGRETSGLLRLSHTLAVQDYMIHSIKVWNTLADAPGISSGLKTAEFSVHVPDIPERYGRMADRWVNPQYAELLHAGKAPEGLQEVLRVLAGPYKMAHVIGGGLTTWNNNFYGNWWHAVLAGGLDIMRPGESGRAYSLAWHMLVNDRSEFGFARRAGATDKAPAITNRTAPLEVVGKAEQLKFWSGDFENAETGRAALKAILEDPEAMAALLREARSFGVDSPGQMGVEVGGKRHDRISRALHEEMEKLGPGASWLDQLRAKKRVMARFANAATEELSHSYDLIDRANKLASYVSLRQKFLREAQSKGTFTHWGEGVPPQEAIEYAASKAAQRIQDSYPDYRSMGKIPEALANIPLLSNPFVRFHLETIRIHATLAKRLVTEPDLMIRLLAMYGVAYVSANTLGMMRRANGISDAEAEAVLKNHTARHRSFRPLTVVMPWRDSDGQPAVLDLSQMWSPSVFFTGHPNDSWAQNAAYGLLHGVAGPAVQPELDDLMHNWGISRKFKDYQPLEGERDPVTMGINLLKQYTAPPGLTRPFEQYLMSKSADKSGVAKYLGVNQNLNGARPTPDSIIGNMMGVPLVPGGGPDSPAFRQAQRSDLSGMLDAKKEVTRAILSGKKDMVPASFDLLRQNAKSLKERNEVNARARQQKRLFKPKE